MKEQPEINIEKGRGGPTLEGYVEISPEETQQMIKTATSLRETAALLKSVDLKKVSPEEIKNIQEKIIFFTAIVATGAFGAIGVPSAVELGHLSDVNPDLISVGLILKTAGSLFPALAAAITTMVYWPSKKEK